MGETKKITVALSPGVLDKLDEICNEKGVKRPAALSFAIDKFWREECSDSEK